MDDPAQFRFSITCEVSDEPVAHCLSALAHLAGGGGHARNPSSAVVQWAVGSKRVTFRFSNDGHREAFLRMATELLHGRWRACGQSDEDPPPSITQ